MNFLLVIRFYLNWTVFGSLRNDIRWKGVTKMTWIKLLIVMTLLNLPFLVIPNISAPPVMRRRLPFRVTKSSAISPNALTTLPFTSESHQIVFVHFVVFFSFCILCFFFYFFKIMFLFHACISTKHTPNTTNFNYWPLE